MYLSYLVDVPDKKGKITFRQKGNAKYVYYEYDRVYDPERKYTIVKRSTIGKLSEEGRWKHPGNARMPAGAAR